MELHRNPEIIAFDNSQTALFHLTCVIAIYMYMSVTVLSLHRGDVVSRSTEKWISGSGRRNRLDVNMTAVRRANLFANRDGRAGVRNKDGKRGEKGPMGGWTVGTPGGWRWNGPGRRGEEPGENIMFPTARGVVYFMIWRAIWHLARGIIHARAARACVCVYAVNPSSSSLRAVSRVAGSGRARVYTRARAHARTHEESPHARVWARDRYALRPSTSKPLEVEALRKYNASRRNLPLSVYTDIQAGYIHVHQERKERRERNEK